MVGFIKAEANSNPCLFGPGPQPLTTVIVRAALGLALGMSSTADEDLSGLPSIAVELLGILADSVKSRYRLMEYCTGYSRSGGWNEIGVCDS